MVNKYKVINKFYKNWYEFIKGSMGMKGLYKNAQYIENLKSATDIFYERLRRLTYAIFSTVYELHVSNILYHLAVATLRLNVLITRTLSI